MTKEQEALLMAIGEYLLVFNDKPLDSKPKRDAQYAMIIAMDYFIQKEVK